jgi:transposase, IS30 family
MEKLRNFTQLNEYKRDRMEALLNSGHKQCEVARILKVDESTISRERGRKRENGYYDASTAQHKAQVKRGNSKYQGMKIEKHQKLRKHIISELKQSQSPECIAGRMREEHWEIRVSSDAIYRWLRSSYGQRYCKYLCTKSYRKKPQKKTPKRHIIPNMESIHSIPPDIDLLTEGDTFVSPKKVSKTSAVLVVWKKSKLLKGDIVKSLSPVHTRRVMKRIHSQNNSGAIILDQGIENQHHEQFGIPTYFCDPASPRQKPLIENSIGQLRKWFWPKGTDLSKITSEEFQEKLEIMNNKYKKSLHYRSANEVSRECGILGGN